MLSYKQPTAELRLHYPKLLEAAFAAALSLVILLLLLSRPLPNHGPKAFTAPEVILETVDIPVTVQQKRLPPPLRPSIPVEDPAIDPELDMPAILFDIAEVPEVLPPPRPIEQEVYEYYAIEVEPKLIGGTAALYRYVAEHQLYPDLALRNRVTGAAQVEFIVGVDGVPRDVKVIGENPPGLGFGDATVKAIQAMRFEPGMQRDRAVPVRMTQAIRFQME